MRKIIVGLIVLSFSVPAMAQKTWDGGSDGTSWDDAGNWNPDGVPTGSDDVVVNAPGTTIVGYEINTSDEFNTMDWQDGTYAGDFFFGVNPSIEMIVSGGLINTFWLQIGRDEDATLTQTGGVVTSNGNPLVLGEVNFPGFGRYNMNGGLLEFDGFDYFLGELNHAGGAIVMPGDQTGANSVTLNPWFHITGPNAGNWFEEYDAGEDITTLGFVETFVVNHSNGATIVHETGETTDSFSVELNDPPTADVTITIDPPTDDVSLNGEAVNAPITLTFTTGDWNVPQTVTVKANDDAESEGPEDHQLTGELTSEDENFNSQINIKVTVIDNDFASVALSKTAANVGEAGGEDTYTVVLAFPPTDTVVITALDASEPNEVTLNGVDAPLELTFTTANWNIGQTVTIAAIDDSDPEGSPHATAINHTSSSAGDSDYDSLDELFGIDDVDVSIEENDCDTGGVAGTQTFGPSDFNMDCITDLLDIVQLALEYTNCSIGDCSAI